MPSIRRLATYRAEMLLLAAALLIVGLVAGSQVLSAGSIDRYHSLIGVVSHIKQGVTESHIWLEERLSGDLTVDTTALIHRPLDAAAADCGAIVAGGTTEHGDIPPMADLATRVAVQTLCARIDDLHVVARERLASGDDAGVGTDLDSRFDGIFRAVIDLADASQATIDRTLAGERQQLALINAGIAAVAGLMLFGLVALVRRYRQSTERTKRNHLVAGAEANAVLAGAQREADRAAVLNRLADRVTFAKGEADLVAAATAALRRLVPSDAGDVLLLNSSQDRLMIAASWGDEDRSIGRPAKVDSPELCPGIRRGSVYALDDAADDLSVGCEAHPVETGSLLCVPMIALGKSVGVLHLARPTSTAFDPGSQQLAARVAEQVALGLANARLLQTMERLAMADPLTGLHNARFFDPLLDRELATAEREGFDLGVLMVDIDHFKRFNDSHGHPGGDEGLKAFARAAKSAIRESDTIARYGGEEFAILVRKADLQATCEVAEKVRVAVEQTIVELGPSRTAKITVSVGVASTSAHGRDRMVLMRTADEALYQAKETGRNRVVAAAASADAGSDPAKSSTRKVRRSAA